MNKNDKKKKKREEAAKGEANDGLERERKRSRLPLDNNFLLFLAVAFFFLLDSSFAYLSIQNFHAKKPGERRLRGPFCLVGLSINYSFY